MVSYFGLVFSHWLTTIYVLMVGVISVAILTNIMKEEEFVSQIVGAMALVPLLLRFIMAK